MKNDVRRNIVSHSKVDEVKNSRLITNLYYRQAVSHELHKLLLLSQLTSSSFLTHPPCCARIQSLSQQIPDFGF